MELEKSDTHYSELLLKLLKLLLPLTMKLKA